MTPWADCLPPLAARGAEREALDAARAGWLADGDLVNRLAAHDLNFREPLAPQAAAQLQQLDAAARDQVSRSAIAEVLIAAPSRRLAVNLPGSMVEQYRTERSRIVARLVDPATGAADLLQDSWRKELLIAAGALLPIGAGFVDLQAGVPRSYLLRGGVGQCLRGLHAVVEAGGFSPFAELHAHTESIAGFSPEGWLQAYQVLAELLSANPALRGVIRANWFIDPQIATISPRLAYTRDVPARHGATFLFVEDDRAGTSGALARSPTRRELFARGDYVPQIHMMIWPRRALLRAFGPQGEVYAATKPMRIRRH
jgi:hypothetical protein